MRALRSVQGQGSKRMGLCPGMLRMQGQGSKRMGLCPGMLRMRDRWPAKSHARDRDEARRIGVLSEDMGGCDRRNRGQQLPLLQPLEFPANLRTATCASPAPRG